MSTAPTADALALHFELKPGSNYKLRAFGKAHILETHTPESGLFIPSFDPMPAPELHISQRSRRFRRMPFN